MPVSPNSSPLYCPPKRSPAEAGQGPKVGCRLTPLALVGLNHALTFPPGYSWPKSPVRIQRLVDRVTSVKFFSFPLFPAFVPPSIAPPKTPSPRYRPERRTPDPYGNEHDDSPELAGRPDAPIELYVGVPSVPPKPAAPICLVVREATTFPGRAVAGQELPK